ncbi:TRAP transporter small permease [Castellaniella sp. S9]|uniref:TRAP transporter small permease n=1 Tax=Castellaniella sp. S9 TaxID=2993652 RepID=UPI0022B3633A|nr:TRAP transporter small permease [Castellaniella sp. S9]
MNTYSPPRGLRINMNAAVIWVVDGFNRIVHALLAFGLLLMVVLISVQIGVRFILPMLGVSASLPWTEELARYVMVWLVFLGGAAAARHGLLIAVLALVDAVPPPAARVMKFLSLLILMGFFVTMAWYGYIWSQFGANETSPAMTISKFWLYLSMPVGFAISAINVLAVLLESISSPSGMSHDRPQP